MRWSGARYDPLHFMLQRSNSYPCDGSVLAVYPINGNSIGVNLVLVHTESNARCQVLYARAESGTKAPAPTSNFTDTEVPK